MLDTFNENGMFVYQLSKNIFTDVWIHVAYKEIGYVTKLFVAEFDVGHMNKT